MRGNASLWSSQRAMPNAISVQIISPTFGLTRKFPPLSAANTVSIASAIYLDRKNAIRPKMNA
jgi:hypothetical protein